MMRQIPTVALLICLALGACRTTDDPAQTATPASAPAAGAASAPAAATPAATPPAAAAEPAPRRAPAQATRGSTTPPAAPAQAEAPPDMDQALAIRQTCWQLVDKNKAIKSLEARADWVSKCIADKNKAAGI